jgi:hypothetical protein
MHTSLCSEKPNGRDHSEDLGVDSKIILKCMHVAQERD